MPAAIQVQLQGLALHSIRFGRLNTVWQSVEFRRATAEHPCALAATDDMVSPARGHPLAARARPRQRRKQQMAAAAEPAASEAQPAKRLRPAAAVKSGSRISQASCLHFTDLQHHRKTEACIEGGCWISHHIV